MTSTPVQPKDLHLVLLQEQMADGRIIPTGPQDGRIRVVSPPCPSALLVSDTQGPPPFSPAPSGIGVLATPAKPSDMRGTWPHLKFHEPGIPLTCDWCDSKEIALAHVAQEFAVCFPCLVKSLEVNLGPRKQQ